MVTKKHQRRPGIRWFLIFSEGVSAGEFALLLAFSIVAIILAGSFLLQYSSTHLAHDHPSSLLHHLVPAQFDLLGQPSRSRLPPQAQTQSARQQPSGDLLNFWPARPSGNIIVDDSDLPPPLPVYARLRASLWWTRRRRRRPETDYSRPTASLFGLSIPPASTILELRHIFTRRSYAPSQRRPYAPASLSNDRINTLAACTDSADRFK